MTRHELPPNPLATAAWVAGTIVALVTILLLWQPELWLWLVAFWAVAGLIGLGVVAAEARAEVEQAKRAVEIRDEALGDRDRIILRLEADNMRMAAELTDTQGRLADALDLACEAPAPVVPLRVVRAPIPMQRRGDEWDRIVQAIESEES